MRLLLVVILMSGSLAASGMELEDCRISLGKSFQGVDALCGSLPRPVNPAEPDGDQIELRVVVIPALDLDPLTDPVVPLAGGPGQGAVSFYLSTRSAFESLRRARDIVLVDQRGTGKSAKLACPVDEELLDGAYSDEQTAELTADCVAQLPHDPRYFTTSVAVQDLEAVREALGYPHFNLYGVSYGSRVAQHYARRYPETTRSVILDGVVPPQLPLGPDIALESQRAVDQLFARCREDAACAAAYPNLEEDFNILLRDLADAPVEVSFDDPATGAARLEVVSDQEVGVAVRLMLYNPQSAALLPLMIDQAVRGNLKPFTAAVNLIVQDLDASIAIGMHNAVMCTEDAPFYAAVDRDSLAQTYMGKDQLSALEAMCSVWPAGVLDDDLRTPLRTDIPVLLLSGTADPITPPAYAEMAMLDMRNARHLFLDNQGHGQLPVGCVSEVVRRFVDSASIDELDAGCIERAFVMPFFLDFAGPTP